MVLGWSLATGLVLICAVYSVLPITSTLANTNDSLRKIQLTVFYETLCPYSMKFFTEQLSTLFNNDTQLYRYVNFDLVPFGNTQIRQVNGEFEFRCQHGPMECEYNKLHACITTGVSLINSDEVNRVYIPFLICMMSTKEEDSVLKECTDRYEVPPDWLRHCQTSKTGNTLLARLGARTRKFKPKIRSVPTIVINGEYNENDQQLAEMNLLQLVCMCLKPKPNVCNLI